MTSIEPTSWLLRNVEVDGRVLDCRLRDGLIVELSPAQPVRAVQSVRPDEVALDAGGGALLPGLSDHHLHVLALAAAAGSIDLHGAAELDSRLAGPGSGWLRVIGAGRELTRADVDAAWPDRPVRVGHRSGALWTLNSAAVELLAAGLTEDECRTGQVWRDDARVRRLGGPDAHLPDLTELGRTLAAHGITHVTDATPDHDSATLAAIGAGLPQHLLSLAAAGSGPRKIVLPDHELIDFATLLDLVAVTHEAGRAIAVHSVTSVTLAMTIAALSEVGCIDGDRIEHAAVCDDAAAERLADLGAVVITQPSIYARHGAAFLAQSPPAERPLLWRYGSLRPLGVRVAASSDAPYGDENPWATIHYAAGRPVEAVPAAEVLQSMLTEPADPAGPIRRITVGAPADLCILTAPLGEVLNASSDSPPVSATFINGRLVHPASSAGREQH